MLVIIQIYKLIVKLNMKTTTIANPVSFLDARIAVDENGIPRSTIIRNLIGFWLLGLCNNYAYVIMLSAAHDVLDQDQGGTDNDNKNSTSNSFLPERECNPISTGAILLANIIPSLLIKLVAPFVLSYTFVQIAFVIGTAFLSFILVSFSTAQWMTFVGVVCASLSSGLGEVTLLRYSTGFDKNVISTWSSGTGASGVLGAFSYAAFTTAGLSPRKTLLIMLTIPIAMAFTFCFLLVHPVKLNKIRKQFTEDRNGIVDNDIMPVLSFKRKLSIIKGLIKYMVPLSLVYFAEYFINQGLLELINIPNTFLTHNEQYRWYQVDYQIGVFLSRSSVNLFQIQKLWILPILQVHDFSFELARQTGSPITDTLLTLNSCNLNSKSKVSFINLAIFAIEAYYLFIPSVWIILALVLFEGSLGGSSYVNTFYKITQEVDESDREFSMGAASMGDSFGITIAGALSIPMHDFLCRTKKP